MIAKRTQRAFTLMEMLVAIGIIALMLIVVLPSIGKLFGSNAEVQARNLIDARLKTARAIAIRDRRPTGVHFQRHHETKEFWTAVVQITTETPDPNDLTTWASLGSTCPSGVKWRTAEVARLAAGTQPAKLPGGVGVGLVHEGMLVPNNPQKRDDYNNLNSYRNTVMGSAPSDGPDAFTCFTIMFDEEGRLDSDTSAFDGTFLLKNNGEYWCSLLFSTKSGDKDVRIWELPEFGDMHAKALCVFDSETFDNLEGSTGVTQADYLNENAQFLPVAPYVGGLIRTAAE